MDDIEPPLGNHLERVMTAIIGLKKKNGTLELTQEELLLFFFFPLSLARLI